MDKQAFELQHCQRCGFMTDGPLHYEETFDLHVCDTCAREYRRLKEQTIREMRRTRPYTGE